MPNSSTFSDQKIATVSAPVETAIRYSRGYVATVLIALFAAAITAWLIFASFRIESLYLDNYGYFCDPAAYYAADIGLYSRYQEQGMLKTVLEEIQTNCKAPGRTVPMLILAPQLLISPTGHLWTEGFWMWTFLTLFGSTVYAQTRSALLACSAIIAFAGIPFLYNPVIGVSAYWLDFTAACTFGCAALSVIRFAGSRNSLWMLAFGAFFSATVLNRWSSAFYLIAFAGVALLAVSVRRPFQFGDMLKSFVYAAVTAIPGLVYFFCFWNTNSWYYKTFGYAIDHPIWQCVKWTCAAIHQLLGGPNLVLLAVLLFGTLILNGIRREDRARALICLWLPVSTFLLLAVLIRMNEALHPFVYFAPALFVCAFGLIPRVAGRWQWKFIGVLAIVVGALNCVYSYEVNRKLANNAPAELKAIKQRDSALAQLILSTGATNFAPFNTESVSPQLEVVFRSGRICTWLNLFSIHEAYLKGRYPGKAPEAIARRLYDETKETADLAAVFTDAHDALKPGVFNNTYSATVSSYISQAMAKDGDWHLVGKVSDPSGELSVYVNTTRKRI